MVNIENVTINGQEAYLLDGYLHTKRRLKIIHVKNKVTLRDVSFNLGSGVGLEFDNVAMTDVSIDLFQIVSFTRPIKDPAIICDTVISSSTCIYNNTKVIGEYYVLMDKASCVESTVTNTRLVNSRIDKSCVTSSPNSCILNTVTMLNSKIEINQDLIEKFILDTLQFKESYEVLYNAYTGALWYVYKKYSGLDGYIIRRLDSDGAISDEKRVVKRANIDRILRDGWEIVRDRMELAFEGVRGIHSGLKPEKRK
jgi:hypothetical protein